MKKQKWYHVLYVKVPTPGRWYCNDILFHDGNVGLLENAQIELLFFLKKRLLYLLYQRRRRNESRKIEMKMKSLPDLGKGSFQIDCW